MEIKLCLGENEKTDLVIKRNWITGGFYYLENGKKNVIKSSLNPSTHFNFQRKKTYEFVVGDREKKEIKIEHIRPLILAGFRSQSFIVYVNGEQHEQFKGY